MAVGTSRPKLKLNYIFCFEILMNVCSVVNVLDQICRFILMPGLDQLWKNGRSCLNMETHTIEGSSKSRVKYSKTSL